MASSDTLKCPTCKYTHHAKTDVFGNRKSKGDFDIREVYGCRTTCPICLEERSDIVALPCGHVMCKVDYQIMGGHLPNFRRGENDDLDTGDVDSEIILINIQGGGIANGTYRRHCSDRNKYTQPGRYNAEDVEYVIEMREDKEKDQKYWYISCHTGNPQNPPVDFYRAKVNKACAYPANVKWQVVSILKETFPSPKSSFSVFNKEVNSVW